MAPLEVLARAISALIAMDIMVSLKIDINIELLISNQPKINSELISENNEKPLWRVK